MLGKLNAHRRLAAVCGAVVMLGVTVFAWPGQASHQPADKLGVAGSVAMVNGPGEDVVLLAQEVRTSATDMVIQATLECSLVTNVKTVGNETSRAAGEVKIWVEIDGEPVPVSSADTGDDTGKVVACYRAYQRTTSLFENDEATIETFFETKETHGFNWIRLDLEPGIHTIRLMAELTEQATAENATAEVVVGKRTLIGDAVKLVNDATIDEQ